jgi:Domain of unknown function (DUF5667)
VSVHHREDAVVAELRRLAPALDCKPDPAFRAATRGRLVAMAAVRAPGSAPASGLWRLLAARAPGAPAARWRAQLTAGLAGAALTVPALAALVAVADGARPGDLLYDVKRGTEQTQLALAGDSRGQTLLGFASTRLDELEALVGSGGAALPAATPAGPADATVSAAGADPGLVLETLRTMDEQTEEGTVWLTDHAVDTADAEPLDHLATWAAGHADGLAALRDLVPDAAGEAVERSLTLVIQVGARTDGLQAALGCPAGPALDGTDALGPVPGMCSAPEPTPPATGGGTTSIGTPTPGGDGAPEATPSALPTVPPATGTGSSGSSNSGDLPTSGAPTPSPGGSLLPPLPLPLPQGGTAGTTTPSALPADPGRGPGPITVCLPPLATIGDC